MRPRSPRRSPPARRPARAGTAAAPGRTRSGAWAPGPAAVQEVGRTVAAEGTTAAAGGPTSVLVRLAEQALDALDLGGELPVPAGADVGLEHQSDARRHSGDDVDGLLDHRHHLVPLPLDVGEHRVRLVGEPGLA